MLLGLANSGCSFLFVTAPPARAEQASQPNADCTTGRAAPVIDGIIAAYQVVRTVYAVQGSNESTFATAPISREADIAWGVGMTGLFVASAIYGGVITSRCRDFKERFPLPSRPSTLAPNGAASRPSPPPSAAVPPTTPPAAAPSPFTAAPRPNGAPL